MALKALTHLPPHPAHTLHLSLLITHSLPAFRPPLSSLSTSFSPVPHSFFSSSSSSSSLCGCFNAFTPPLHSRWCFIHQSRRYSTHPLASYFLPRPSTAATLLLFPNTWYIPGGQGTPSYFPPLFLLALRGSHPTRLGYNRTCEAGESHVSPWGRQGCTVSQKCPTLVLASYR